MCPTILGRYALKSKGKSNVTKTHVEKRRLTVVRKRITVDLHTTTVILHFFICFIIFYLLYFSYYIPNSFIFIFHLHRAADRRSCIKDEKIESQKRLLGSGSRKSVDSNLVSLIF